VVPYSDKFKAKLVAKMFGPPVVSASRLSREVGIGQPTLSRWKREATLPLVVRRKKRFKVRSQQRPRVEESATEPETRRVWTPEEKLRLLGEIANAGEEGLGELLRREGLHEADVRRFREEALSGLRGSIAKSRKPSPEAKRVKDLERELRRKERALAEAAALLVLRKKAEAFFLGEEEGDTNEKNEK
jgi:transposase-like protein